MGYSCTAAAGLTLDALAEMLSPRSGPASSNAIPGFGFWEQGRENADGAITGTVNRDLLDRPGYCRKVGSFRIEPDGSVKRFPGVPAATLRAAEIKGRAEYDRRYRYPGALGLSTLTEGA